MRHESIPDGMKRRLKDLSFECKFMLIGLLITVLGILLRIFTLFSGNIEIFIVLVGWFGFFVSFGVMRLEKVLHRLVVILVSLAFFLIILAKFWPDLFRDVIVLIALVMGLIIGGYVLNIYLFKKVGEQDSPL